MNLEQYGIGVVNTVLNPKYWDLHKEGLKTPLPLKVCESQIMEGHYFFFFFKETTSLN